MATNESDDSLAEQPAVKSLIRTTRDGRLIDLTDQRWKLTLRFAEQPTLRRPFLKGFTVGLQTFTFSAVILLVTDYLPIWIYFDLALLLLLTAGVADLVQNFVRPLDSNGDPISLQCVAGLRSGISLAAILYVILGTLGISYGNFMCDVRDCRFSRPPNYWMLPPLITLTIIMGLQGLAAYWWDHFIAPDRVVFD